MATLYQVERAIERYQERIMKMPNVVGIGITKDPDAGGDARKGHVLAVYVSEKVPKKDLGSTMIVPPVLSVRTVGKERQVPTHVIETGTFTLAKEADVTPTQGFSKEAL